MDTKDESYRSLMLMFKPVLRVHVYVSNIIDRKSSSQIAERSLYLHGCSPYLNNIEQLHYPILSR